VNIIGEMSSPTVALPLKRKIAGNRRLADDDGEAAYAKKNDAAILQARSSNAPPATL